MIKLQKFNTIGPRQETLGIVMVGSCLLSGMESGLTASETAFTHICQFFVEKRHVTSVLTQAQMQRIQSLMDPNNEEQSLQDSRGG
jgi:hypothetical protein